MPLQRSLFYLLFTCLPFLAIGQISSALITIDGLTCSMCTYGVEVSLKKLPFVDAVEMDLNANTAAVTFAEGEVVSLHSLSDQVRNAGFSVRSLKVELQVNPKDFQAEGPLVVGHSAFVFKGESPEKVAGPLTLTLIGKGFMAKKAWKDLQKNNSLAVLNSESPSELGVVETCIATL